MTRASELQGQNINLSGPLVSVVTSTYGHEPYLDDYFKGLLTQTYQNIELVLFDDGSPDNSWQKIQAYLPRLRARFPRLIVERHENLGVLEEMAQGVDAATGDYICFLESDDYYYPDKITETVRYFEEHPDVGVVHTDFDRLVDGRILPIAERPERDRRARAATFPTGDVLAELLRANFVSMPTIAIRADLLRQHVDFRSFHARGYLMGDYPMLLRLARQTSFGFVPRPLSVYRQLRESASNSRDPRRLHHFLVSYHRIVCDFLEEFGDPLDVAGEAALRYHQQLYLGGFEYGVYDDCKKGAAWLRQHAPSHTASGTDLIRRTATIHPWVWAIVQGARPYLQRARHLFSRRSDLST